VDSSALGGTRCGRFREGIRWLNKQQRPDGLFVTGGPLMRAHQKRIVGFTLKSRLPSVYTTREFVDAGGLMSYGADEAEGYRRVAYYVDKTGKAHARTAV